MTELFTGVKPCNKCIHYMNDDGKHTCTKAKQLTETARITLVNCYDEKTDKDFS